MIYTLIFTIVGGSLDGTTVVNLPIPAAQDGSGEFRFGFQGGDMGIIDPAMLAPLVGAGGYLLCGVAVTAPGGNTSVALQGRIAGSVSQSIPPYTPALVADSVYTERPCYVPPFYQLVFFNDTEPPDNYVVRIDIAPLLTVKQAARALRVTRPNLLVPGAAIP